MSLAQQLLSSSVWQGMASAWRWWLAELADMLPDRMQQPRETQDCIDIHLGGTGTEIFRQRRGKGEKLASAEAFGELDKESWEAIEALASENPLRLFPGPSMLFRHELILPSAASPWAIEAARLQLPFIMPVDPTQLDVAFLRGTRDGPNRKIHIVAARQSDLDRIDQAFAEAGLMPPVIAAETEHGIAVLRRPIAIAAAPKERHQRNMVIASLVVLLGLPLYIILGAQFLTGLNEDRVSLLEERNANLMRLERSARQEDRLRRIAAAIAEQTPISASLEKLARQLPRSAWVIEGGRRPGEGLSFTVETSDEASLRSALPESDYSLTGAEPVDGGKIHVEVRSQS